MSSPRINVINSVIPSIQVLLVAQQAQLPAIAAHFENKRYLHLADTKKALLSEHDTTFQVISTSNPAEARTLLSKPEKHKFNLVILDNQVVLPNGRLHKLLKEKHGETRVLDINSCSEWVKSLPSSVYWTAVEGTPANKLKEGPEPINRLKSMTQWAAILLDAAGFPPIQVENPKNSQQNSQQAQHLRGT